MLANAFRAGFRRPRSWPGRPQPPRGAGPANRSGQRALVRAAASSPISANPDGTACPHPRGGHDGGGDAALKRTRRAMHSPVGAPPNALRVTGAPGEVRQRPPWRYRLRPGSAAVDDRGAWSRVHGVERLRALRSGTPSRPRRSRPRSYAPWVAASGAATLGAAVLRAQGSTGLQRFIGPLNPVITVATAGAAGFGALAFLGHRGFWGCRTNSEAVRGSAVATVAAIPLAAGAIAFDVARRFPRDTNLEWPEAWLAYPAIAVVAETAVHLLPLAGLVWLTEMRLDGRMWLVVLPTAAVEPSVQVALGSAHRAFVVPHVFIIGVVQLQLLRRYGALPMLWFRVSDYLLWHVLMGAGSADTAVLVRMSGGAGETRPAASASRTIPDPTDPGLRGPVAVRASACRLPGLNVTVPRGDPSPAPRRRIGPIRGGGRARHARAPGAMPLPWAASSRFPHAGQDGAED